MDIVVMGTHVPRTNASPTGMGQRSQLGMKNRDCKVYCYGLNVNIESENKYGCLLTIEPCVQLLPIGCLQPETVDFKIS